MSSLPPRGQPPDRAKRRMLPSVSDVVRELTLTTTADTPTLFKAARQVCAEELNRVKQGFESEALEVLVRRAEKLVDPSFLTSHAPAEGAAAFEVPAERTDPESTPDPFAAEPESEAPPARPAASEADDPFAETAAAMGLGWSRELSGPFASVEPEPAPAAPNDVEQPPAVVTTGHSVLDELEGPGEDTLAGLTREAAGMDLHSVLPKVKAAEAAGGFDERVALDSQSLTEELPSYEASRQEEYDRLEPETQPLVGTLESAAAGEAAAESSKQEAAQTAERRRESTLVLSMPNAPRRTGLVLTVLIFVGILGAGLYFGLGRRASKAPEGAPAAGPDSPETALPIATPAAAGEAPATEPVAAAVPATAVAPPAGNVGTASAEPRDTPAPVVVERRSAVVPDVPAGVKPGTAVCASPDWSGNHPIYAIHFGSHKERENAEREAATLAKRLNMPMHALEVDLGPKGIWYRSLAGEFATLEEAREKRAELEAQKTPNMGFVYYVVGVK